jgi:hypothetical protein
MTTTAEHNRQARIDRIGAQIADLQAQRAALLDPPFAKGDKVTRLDAEHAGRDTVWTVRAVDSADPRKVGLDGPDGRMAMNIPADSLVRR